MPASTVARLRLRRGQRLRAGRDFVRLKAEGYRHVCGCLILNWQPAATTANDLSRLGVVTSKTIGGSVVRSRARRLLREVFRRHQLDLSQPVSAVLVARKSIVGSSFARVEADFLSALRQARLLRPQGIKTPTA